MLYSKPEEDVLLFSAFDLHDPMSPPCNTESCNETFCLGPLQAWLKAHLEDRLQ